MDKIEVTERVFVKVGEESEGILIGEEDSGFDGVELVWVDADDIDQLISALQDAKERIKYDRTREERAERLAEERGRASHDQLAVYGGEL